MNDRLQGLIGATLAVYGVTRTIGAAPASAQDQGNRTRPADDDADADPPPRSGPRARSGVKGSVDRWQRATAPVAFTHAVVKKFTEDGGGRLAATVAYYGFFSVFPALLAMAAVAGFVLDGNPELRADVVDTAVAQFPVIGGSITEASLQGSGLALVVGVAGAVWAGLGAMLAVQHALNTVWDVPWHERPDPVRARIRGLLMFGLIGIGLVGATVLTNLVTEVPMAAPARIGVAAANAAVNIVLAWLAFQVLTARRLSWTDLWPGAIAAGLVFYALQNLGSLLVTRYVANASDTYGTFALVIGLLTWFHVVSQATLLAAEINVVRSRRLWPRSMFGDNLTEADDRALLGFQRAAARHPSAEPDSPARSAERV